MRGSPDVDAWSAHGGHARADCETMIQQTGAFILALVGMMAVAAAAPRQAPKTPPGLAGCNQTLRPIGPLPEKVGETIRYHVAVDGIPIGRVDFRIERLGQHAGLPVVEYRSLFELDGLVAAFVPAEGRAASLVQRGDYAPQLAMNRYKLDGDDYIENISYRRAGMDINATRIKNGKTSEVEKRFPAPAQDFISAFYLLRALARDVHGCTLIYGNHRTYTVWIQPDGHEDVMTPVGTQPADRYRLRFGSEKSAAPREAVLWMSQDTQRLPFRVEIRGDHPLEAVIHLYETRL